MYKTLHNLKLLTIKIKTIIEYSVAVMVFCYFLSSPPLHKYYSCIPYEDPCASTVYAVVYQLDVGQRFHVHASDYQGGSKSLCTNATSF